MIKTVSPPYGLLRSFIYYLETKCPFCVYFDVYKVTAVQTLCIETTFLKYFDEVCIISLKSLEILERVLAESENNDSFKSFKC